jgi:4-amino-4-deoxy-L-arabinose transferase-like glycosyltransferase
MKRTTTVLLLGIILLGSVLRLVAIGSNPPSTYWDETSLGYDAYSILKTGKDYHGNFLPILAFTSFGDYKPSLYFYSIVPFIALFGPTTEAIRLPSALAGIFTIYLVYLLGKRLKSEQVGLCAALCFAVQPWSVHISRAGFETNLATMLIALGVYWCLVAKQKPKFLLLAAVAFVLSMYSYHAARIVAPLLAVVTVLVVFGKDFVKQMRWVVVSGMVAVALLYPVITNLTNPVLLQRAAETSIFAGTTIVEVSNSMREADGSGIVSRVFHHRNVVAAQLFMYQYAQNFSLKYLFLDGDGNLRHGTQLFGVLHHWEFFTVLLGLYVLLCKKEDHSLGKIIFLWILLAAIPVAVTTVSPHSLRFLSAAPAFALLSGLGLSLAFDWIPKKWKKVGLFVIVGVIAVELVAVSYTEFVLYPKIAAREWQYGYKELVQDIEALRKPNQQVFITREQGRPSIYFLWYLQQDPKVIQEQDAHLKKDQQELLEFGPYHFVDNIPTERGALVASSPERMPAGAKQLQTIQLPTGEIIWTIWEQR